MKAKTFWKFLLLGLLAAALSLFACAQPLVLEKGQLFTARHQDMVVLEKMDFAKYHYTQSKYDTLKKQLYQFNHLLIQKDSTISFLQSEYDALLFQKDQALANYQSAYTAAKGSAEQAIAINRLLQADYKRLEQKNRRVKRWRNFFMGTALVSTSVLILLVVH